MDYKTHHPRMRRVSVAAILVITAVLGSSAYSQTDFYKGKTITIIQGRGPGGSGDMRVRAIAHFLPKYLPGNPAIIFEYMPGGGGMKAANHIYNLPRPDGLTIASVSSGLMSSAILGVKAVKYQIDRFHYLGAADAGGHYIFYTRKELGVNSLDKLRATAGIRIGAQAVGHSNYNIARLLAYLVPLKDPKFVTGYASPEIDAAILAWTCARSSADVLAEMRKAEVPNGPIYNVADMMADPHFNARGMFESVEVNGKPLRIPAIPPLLGETPGRTDAPGPALGAHTEEVLGRLLGLKPPFE